MNKKRSILAILFFIAVYLIIPMEMTVSAAEVKKLIYDEAGLLNQDEYDELNLMANEYGAERETDIIILTSNNDNNIDVMNMTQDFYDAEAPGYDKPHGNTVILTLEMRNRGIYLAGFYKGEVYLDDSRLDQIRDTIVPDLINGDYGLAFQKYIQTVHEYMGIEPSVNSGVDSGINSGINSGVNSGIDYSNDFSNDSSVNSRVNPDNILFNGWFQLAVSMGLGGLIVGIMAYRSGGRVTVNSQTYEDASTSGILERQDTYIRTTTTRRKIEKNNNGGSGGRTGGGGGGGTTGGGHSHSGSRGSF